VEKWRLREDLITAKLTTTVEDVQKVEFVAGFWSSFPRLASTGGNNRWTRSTKGGDYIGVVYQD
jgi:hypothetical protein